MTNQQTYLENVSLARQAAQAYYTGQGVIMDDAEYDRLLAELRQFEQSNPEATSPDSPTQSVGAAGGEVAHAVPMLSLDNVFSAEELQSWLESVNGAEVVVEPKLDGLALAITYRDGQVVRLVTRGDGRAGEDVTYARHLLTNLPATAGTFTGEVRGEVLFTKEQFTQANEYRVDNGDSAFVNARNGAAGALRGAADRTYLLPLSFFAYDVVADDTWGRHSEVLDALRSFGFEVSSDLVNLPEKASAQEAVASIAAQRGALSVDIDGAVIKVDDRSVQGALGYTARAPRWATAYKYPADTVFTKLVEVEWQVGRTGVITPRGRVEPVSVGGVTITYATLHNPDDIARRGFKIGDTVSVYRAGEVIPRIEAPLVDKRTGEETEISFPQVCPNCDGEVDRSEARWRCAAGRGCGLDRWVTYACSRDALDIEGLGGVHAKNVVEAGLVEDVADIFTLSEEQLASLDRMGAKNAAKVVAQIHAARGQDLGRVITALGIRGTGRTLSRRMAAALGSLEALSGADEARLSQIEGIGTEKAELIAGEVAQLREVIAKLVRLGVNPQAQQVSAAQGPLNGQVVCVTGTIPGLSRTQAGERVESLGGKVTGSVSSATTLLVAGDKAGSKLKAAQSKGIAVMDAETFLALT